MRRTTASELQVGDVFYREIYRKPDTVVDPCYTVRDLKRYPVHDFFGKMHDRIECSADDRITGPQRLLLGPEEPVWVVD